MPFTVLQQKIDYTAVDFQQSLDNMPKAAALTVMLGLHEGRGDTLHTDAAVLLHLMSQNVNLPFSLHFFKYIFFTSKGHRLIDLV